MMHEFGAVAAPAGVGHSGRPDSVALLGRPLPADHAVADRRVPWPYVGARPGPSRHIGIFIYALTGGGAQRRTVTLANAFAARGHRVDLIVVRTAGILKGELSPAVRLVGLDRDFSRVWEMTGRFMRQRGIQTALSIPLLAEYLRSERPDVLLSAASHVNLVALSAWRLAARPLPIVLRASNYPSGNLDLWPMAQRIVRSYMRWLAGRLYPWADAVIAVSDGVADEVARLTGMPRERLTTIYNPVVTPELILKTKAPVDHPWFAPGSPPVVLSAGTLKIQKDYPTLVRAFARVRVTRPARLVILGEGGQRRHLEAMVARLGLGQDVLLPGYVSNPPAWMARASVFVLSSAWEGLPGVLIEALSAGCPVVSTDCPSGPAEILDHGTYGPLVPCHDETALAEAILAVLKAPIDRNRLCARAALFSAEGPPDRYLEVLERCIRRWGETRKRC